MQTTKRRSAGAWRERKFIGYVPAQALANPKGPGTRISQTGCQVRSSVMKL
jgi:hypothetical protein